jgi:hypothetical protein
MAELVQLRRLFRDEASSLGYNETETAKHVLEQLALHDKKEENRRAHELAIEAAHRADEEKRRADEFASEEAHRTHELVLEWQRAIDMEKDRQAQIKIAELAAGIRPMDPNDPANSPASYSSANSAPPPPRYASVWTDIYNPQLESFDVYLKRYTDSLALFDVPPEIHCRLLVSTLKGEDYLTYTKLPIEERESFAALNNVLLTRHELHASNYATRFRSSTLQAGETYSQFAERIKSYFKSGWNLANMTSHLTEWLT